jgi:hypothetical protein
MIESYFEGNPSINACIFECFQYLDQQDVTALQRKIKSDSRLTDKGEFFHTFRELIVGSYLARRDHRVRWQKEYDALTPDWSILGRHEEATGLVEVMNFRADPQTEASVRAALGAGTSACFPYDEQKTEQRLRSKLIDKFKYKELTESLEVPYTIACFCFLDNPVDTEVVRRVLYSTEFGLFRNSGDGIYPHVSGVVLFGEVERYEPPDAAAIVYKFLYFPNPHAARPFAFPVGDYYQPMSISNREQHRLFMRFAKGEFNEEQFFLRLDQLREREHDR